MAPDDSSMPSSQILLKLGEMGMQLAVISEQLKAVPDHEQRLRTLEAGNPPDQEPRLKSLERWRYALPASAFAALASAGVAIASWFHH